MPVPCIPLAKWHENIQKLADYSDIGRLRSYNGID